MIWLKVIYYAVLLLIAALLVALPDSAISAPLIAGLALLLLQMMLFSKGILGMHIDEQRSSWSNLVEKFNSLFGERTGEWIRAHNEGAFILSRYERDNPLQNLKSSENRLRLQFFLNKVKGHSKLKNIIEENRQKLNYLESIAQQICSMFSAEEEGLNQLCKEIEHWKLQEIFRMTGKHFEGI